MNNGATLAGALVAAGWFVFLDAIVVQRRLGRLPETALVDWLPGALAMLGFSAMLFVPVDAFALSDSGRVLTSRRHRACASCGFFGASTLCFSSIMVAVALAQTRYQQHVSELVRASDAYSAWPALATLAQTTLIVASAVVLVFRRVNLKSENMF